MQGIETRRKFLNDDPYENFARAVIPTPAGIQSPKRKDWIAVSLEIALQFPQPPFGKGGRGGIFIHSRVPRP